MSYINSANGTNITNNITNNTNNTNNNNNTTEIKDETWLLFIPFTALIIIIVGLFLFTMYSVVLFVVKCSSKKIKQTILKYCNGDEINVNGELSKKYIKKLNSKNQNDNITDDDIDCAICIEKITKRQKSVTLNCGHKFHKNCLQPWIKTQTSNYNSPTCPLDRTIIIQIPKVEEYFEVDYNSDYD